MKKTKSNLFNILFLLLVSDCIIDPSDKIFNLKVLLLCFTFIIGFLTKKTRNELILFSLFISLIFPLLYFIIGVINFENYSFEIFIMQWKPYLFFVLLPFISESQLKSYAQLTFLIIPFSIVALYVIINFDIFSLEPFIGDYEDTLKIANRDFGGVEFLMVYHKTVSLLIFGLAFSLYHSKESFFYRLLAVGSVVVIFLSSTRANWIALIFVLSFHMYKRYISNSNILKISSFFLVCICIIFFLPKLIITFFSKDEGSISARLSFIEDYETYWTNNPFNLILGQGFGNGMISVLRGISYNLEFSFLEIIRIYGIVGFIFYILFFIYPIFIYLKNYKLITFPLYYDYLFFAYFVFIFIIVPTNPLLFSSTGFLLLLVFYSEVFYIKRLYNQL